MSGRKRAAFESPAVLLRPVAHDPAMKRPMTIVTGSALVWLRVAAGLLVAASIWLEWARILDDAEEAFDLAEVSAGEARLLLWAVLGVMLLFLAVDLVVSVFVWLGRNWARVYVMTFAVLSISVAFIGWWARDASFGVESTLLAIGLDVLVLLALSSRSAAAYARRREADG